MTNDDEGRVLMESLYGRSLYLLLAAIMWTIARLGTFLSRKTAAPANQIHRKSQPNAAYNTEPPASNNASTAVIPKRRGWWLRPSILLPTMVLVPLAFYHIREYSQKKQFEEPHIQATSVSAQVVSAETLEFLDLGLAAIPHPAKVKNKGGMGEDYAFSSRRVLAVSDGVGGWNEVGVDPSAYSRGLMTAAYNVEKEAVRQHKTLSGTRDPISLLQKAYEACKSITGSATATVVTIHNNTLNAANLGDSGFMVVRNGKVVLRSKEQQKAFNFPYQLGTQSPDLPTHADRYTLTLQESDVVVLGTDGLWDNLFDKKTVEIVSSYQLKKDNAGSRYAQALADELARAASVISKSKDITTPFEVASGNRWRGGKLDDITVVAAVVGPTPAHHLTPTAVPQTDADLDVFLKKPQDASPKAKL